MYRWIGALAVALLAAGCSNGNSMLDLGPSDSGAPLLDFSTGGPTVHVGANGTKQFSPAMLTIAAGQTVTWVFDSSGHTVTSGTVDPNGTEHIDGTFCSNGQPPPSIQTCTPVGGNVLTSAAGSNYKFTFTTRGSFPYFCIPHGPDGMQGTIAVQ